MKERTSGFHSGSLSFALFLFLTVSLVVLAVFAAVLPILAVAAVLSVIFSVILAAVCIVDFVQDDAEDGAAGVAHLGHDFLGHAVLDGAGFDEDHAAVTVGADHGGIDHEAEGRAVDDDVVRDLLAGFDEAPHGASGEELGGVRRDLAAGDKGKAADVRAAEGVVHGALVREVVGEAEFGGLAGDHAGDAGVAHVRVDEDDGLAELGEGAAEIEGDGGFAFAGKCAGEQQDLLVRAAELDIGSEEL